MHIISRKNHVIDLLFPITLFFILLICSLMLILFSADVYGNTTEKAESNYETTVALSYIKEKIHQSDGNASIFIDTFDGQESLVIEEQYDGQIFRTYIYEYDQGLWELFVQDGISASASDGSKIIDVSEFTMKQEHPQLFTFTCTAKTGSQHSIHVAVLSQPED